MNELRAERLPLLLERADVNVVRPCAAILMREEPVGFRNRRRLQHVVRAELRESLANGRHVDRAVHVDVRDVDALGCRSRAISCASPRLANLAGPNAAEVGNGFTPAVAPVNMITPAPRFSIAGTASCAARNTPNVLTRQVFSKVLGLVFINLPNGRIAALYSSASTSPSSRRIFVQGFADVCRLRGVGRHRDSFAAVGLNLFCERGELVFSARDQCDGVFRGESASQRCAQSGTDANDYANRTLIRRRHDGFLLSCELRIAMLRDQHQLAGRLPRLHEFVRLGCLRERE